MAATAAAVVATTTPNLMVTATAVVVANVVEAVLNPPPIHAVAALHYPPIIATGRKGLSVADNEGHFFVGG